MSLCFKRIVLPLMVLSAANLASAEDTVEMSLTTTCDCFQMGSLSSYVGEVFAAAVVEVPRSSVEGRSQEELRDALTAKQYLALQDAARNACTLQAAKNLHRDRARGNAEMLSPGDGVRVYCSGDIRFGVSRR